MSRQRDGWDGWDGQIDPGYRPCGSAAWPVLQFRLERGIESRCSRPSPEAEHRPRPAEDSIVTRTRMNRASPWAAAVSPSAVPLISVRTH